MFGIHDIEQLTGIKAHTIRIWEKRYRLLTPNRTETNIRYYDENQVHKILNVSTLINQGYKISNISEMSEQEVFECINSLQVDPPDHSNSSLFINHLIQSMINFDEIAFDKTLDRAIEGKGIFSTYLEIIYPFLIKTGVLWNTKNIIPAQEHFIVHLIKKKIISAIGSLPLPTNHSKVYVLFLFPNEWHELGLLLADFLIRQKGFKTIYLGQNLPFSNLKETLKKTNAKHLVSFYHRRNHSQKNQQEIEFILKSQPDLILHLNTSIDSGEVFSKIKQVKTYLDANQFLAQI